MESYKKLWNYFQEKKIDVDLIGMLTAKTGLPISKFKSTLPLAFTIDFKLGNYMHGEYGDLRKIEDLREFLSDFKERQFILLSNYSTVNKNTMKGILLPAEFLSLMENSISDIQVCFNQAFDGYHSEMSNILAKTYMFTQETALAKQGLDDVLLLSESAEALHTAIFWDEGVLNVGNIMVRKLAMKLDSVEKIIKIAQDELPESHRKTKDLHYLETRLDVLNNCASEMRKVWGNYDSI